MMKVAKDPLNFQQRAFVDEYLSNGGNATKAAQKAYNVTTYNSASAVGFGVLRTPKVAREIQKARKSMREIFDELGATDETIARVFVDGMHNAKRYFFKGDKLAAVADHNERRQNAKEIATIKELYPSTKVDLNANVKTDSPAIQQIADLLQQVYREKTGKYDGSIDANNKDPDIVPVQKL